MKEKIRYQLRQFLHWILREDMSQVYNLTQLAAAQMGIVEQNVYATVENSARLNNKQGKAHAADALRRLDALLRPKEGK